MIGPGTGPRSLIGFRAGRSFQNNIEGTRMTANRPKTKILLDGGDPEETRRIRDLLGLLDGQTTNPTFVAKNPEVQRRIASGHKLSVEEQKQEYKQIVKRISPLVGSAGVSIEVFGDFDTT